MNRPEAALPDAPGRVTVTPCKRTKWTSKHIKHQRVAQTPKQLVHTNAAGKHNKAASKHTKTVDKLANTAGKHTKTTG
jgi:hypothetical protein